MWNSAGTKFVSFAVLSCLLGACEKSTAPDCGGDGSQVDVFNGTADGQTLADNSVDTFPDAIRNGLVYVGISGVGNCTGTLVARTRVLTAAHCFALTSEFKPGGFVILNPKAKTWANFGLNSAGAKPERGRNGFNIRLHPNEDLATFDLEGAAPSPFAPVELWRDGEIELKRKILFISEATRADVFGFGFADVAQTKTTTVALHGVMTFWENRKESKLVGGMTFLNSIIFNSASTKQATRPGDSGGPLMLSQGGQWKQIGVVSGGTIETGESDTDSRFADVRKNVDWILEGANQAVPPPVSPPPAATGGPAPAELPKRRVCDKTLPALNVRDESLGQVLGVVLNNTFVELVGPRKRDASGVEYIEVTATEGNTGSPIRGYVITGSLCLR